MMRVNVYAEELSENVEIIAKEIAGQVFTGLRLWLYLPVTLPDGTQARGPFMHHPGDDDSSAITIWGKRDLRELLRKALALLDAHYAKTPAPPAHRSALELLRILLPWVQTDAEIPGSDKRRSAGYHARKALEEARAVVGSEE